MFFTFFRYILVIVINDKAKLKLSLGKNMITTLSTTSKLGDIEVEFDCFDDEIELISVNYSAIDSGRVRDIKSFLLKKTREEIGNKAMIKWLKSGERTSDGDRLLRCLMSA